MRGTPDEACYCQGQIGEVNPTIRTGPATEITNGRTFHLLFLCGRAVRRIVGIEGRAQAVVVVPHAGTHNACNDRATTFYLYTRYILKMTSRCEGPTDVVRIPFGLRTAVVVYLARGIVGRVARSAGLQLGFRVRCKPAKAGEPHNTRCYTLSIPCAFPTMNLATMSLFSPVVDMTLRTVSSSNRRRGRLPCTTAVAIDIINSPSATVFIHAFSDQAVPSIDIQRTTCWTLHGLSQGFRNILYIPLVVTLGYNSTLVLGNDASVVFVFWMTLVLHAERFGCSDIV